ncbi:MAG TPA: response regulator [Bryobacteraceae bacterium]|nr:response regulator [Bryobacteraceae bacterium]
MARILLVDDDKDQLEMRRLLLDQAGHEVQAAGSVEEAERLLDVQTPKLVLMDLRLPRTEDGLTLIRRVRASAPRVKIVVLSGYLPDLSNLPEEGMVDQVLSKPMRSEKLLRTITRLALFIVCLMPLRAQSVRTFALQVESPAEVVAEMDISASGADWGRAGRESVLVTMTVDELRKQHLMLYAGGERHVYRAWLGELQPGAHTVKLERHPDYSARGIPLEVHRVNFRPYQPSDPDYAVIVNAPALFARTNTIGKFTDIPLLLYCERLGDGSLRYTMIFSNEDGGTDTRGLMARWGRTTDIEHIYQVWPDKSGKGPRAQIQTRDHKDVEFQGKREGMHPLLAVVTDNNMVAGDSASAVRYHLAPVVADLGAASREKVMDENLLTYVISARELEREGKLRKFGTVEGSKISSPENYLHVEMRLLNKEARIAVLVRLQGENFFRSSHSNMTENAIERSGWVRTTIELPPATQPGQVAEIALQCLPEPKTDGSGSCRVESIGKMFFLNSRQQPDENFWRPGMDKGPWIIPAGHTRLVPVR